MADDTENSKWSKLLEPEHLEPLSENDKLFKSDDDWGNNACVNYLSDNWNIYVIGYKDAADVLVAHVEKHQRGQDFSVYPIVFLYRQYLELEIKYLIRQGRKLQDIHKPIPTIHQIDKLWGICSKLLHEISPGESERELSQIARLIDEFCKIDPNSTAFRYPLKWDGDPSLPPAIKIINLRNIKDVIDKISVLMRGAASQFDYYL